MLRRQPPLCYKPGLPGRLDGNSSQQRVTSTSTRTSTQIHEQQQLLPLPLHPT